MGIKSKLETETNIYLTTLKKFKQTLEAYDREPSKLYRKNYIIITPDKLEYYIKKRRKEKKGE